MPYTGMAAVGRTGPVKNLLFDGYEHDRDVWIWERSCTMTNDYDYRDVWMRKRTCTMTGVEPVIAPTMLPSAAPRKAHLLLITQDHSIQGH
jgi:hypothetical protein